MSRGANTVRLLPVVIIVYLPTGVATRIVCTLAPLTVSGLPNAQLWNLGLSVCKILKRSEEEGGRGDEEGGGEKEKEKRKRKRRRRRRRRSIRRRKRK